MSKIEYVFENLNTALYKEGYTPKDYLPKHGMPILKYEDVDIILQLIIHSPNKTDSESKFAWVKYLYNEESGYYEIDDVTLAEFEDGVSENEQKLPSRERIGIIVYNKLTGLLG